MLVQLLLHRRLSHSEGGLVKTFMKSRVVAGQLQIRRLRNLFGMLTPSLDFELREVDSTDARECANKVSPDQMLMTQITASVSSNTRWDAREFVNKVSPDQMLMTQTSASVSSNTSWAQRTHYDGAFFD